MPRSPRCLDRTPPPAEPAVLHGAQCTDRRRRTLLAAAAVGAPLLWLKAGPASAAEVAAGPAADPTAGAASSTASNPRAPQPAFRDEGFSTVDLEWADATRQRPVPVRLHLPVTATEDQPAPLVVFSHGIGGSRQGYRYLGHHWASSGYASLHLQHVGSDRNLWFGNPFGLVGRLRDAAQDNEAIARVQDLRFALDQVLASRHAARLDVQRIVAAGHSYGANTALLAAGARVERRGRWVALGDARIQAAIVLSAPPFYGESDAASILGGVTMPTLHVTATEDIIRIPGYYSGADDRIAVFNAVGGPRKTLAVFAGGSHSMFTDRAGTGGAVLNPQVKAATRALSVAFLQSVFQGDDEALKRWPAGFSDILARFTPPAG